MHSSAVLKRSPQYLCRACRPEPIRWSTITLAENLFAGTAEPIYVCSLVNRGEVGPAERHVYTRRSRDIERFAAKWDQEGRGLFFCVSTVERGKPRKKENAVESPFLHTDVDFKDLDCSPANALAALMSLEVPPSCIVKSGNGVHAYWLLDRPCLDGKRVEADLRKLAVIVGGDPAVAHRAALMRMPGSHNTKDGAWTEVEVMFDTGRRHALEELEAWLARQEPVIPHKAKVNLADAADNPFSRHGADQEFKPPIDVEARLAAMVHRGHGDAGVHQTQLSCTSSLLNAGWSVDAVVFRVLEATRRVAEEGWDMEAEEIAIRKMCTDWIKKHPEVEEAIKAASANLLLTSAQFVDGFKPPDYLIDGLMQKRFLYSFTGPTGAGKTAVAMVIALHVSLGLPLGERAVEKGKVLYFAGENPDDVRMRWIKLCAETGNPEDNPNVFWRAGSLKLSDKELRRRIMAEAQANGPFALIVIDTSAAFFDGDDENSNTQLGNHARTMRSYVDVSGGPTILVTCHPIKTPDMDNLVPRGGGAFLNEVDGNLVCVKHSLVAEVHWHGKMRGPDFAPIPFMIAQGTCGKLVDSKGQPIITVTARAITYQEQSAAEQEQRSNQDEVMRAMATFPESSIRDLAVKLAWFYDNGQPDSTRVYRAIQALKDDHLVKKERGKYVLTKKILDLETIDLAKASKEKAKKR